MCLTADFFVVGSEGVHFFTLGFHFGGALEDSKIGLRSRLLKCNVHYPTTLWVDAKFYRRVKKKTDGSLHISMEKCEESFVFTDKEDQDWLFVVTLGDLKLLRGGGEEKEKKNQSVGMCVEELNTAASTDYLVSFAIADKLAFTLFYSMLPANSMLKKVVDATEDGFEDPPRTKGGAYIIDPPSAVNLEGLKFAIKLIQQVYDAQINLLRGVPLPRQWWRCAWIAADYWGLEKVLNFLKKCGTLSTAFNLLRASGETILSVTPGGKCLCLNRQATYTVEQGMVHMNGSNRLCLNIVYPGGGGAENNGHHNIKVYLSQNRNNTIFCHCPSWNMKTRRKMGQLYVWDMGVDEHANNDLIPRPMEWSPIPDGKSEESGNSDDKDDSGKESPPKKRKPAIHAIMVGGNDGNDGDKKDDKDKKKDGISLADIMLYMLMNESSSSGGKKDKDKDGGGDSVASGLGSTQ
jgi:hypothetical protein